MRSTAVLVSRQLALIGLAALAYFGVRGLTEGAADTADRNAERVLDLERPLGIDIEAGLQEQLSDDRFLVDLANWIYMWGHWPVIALTLVWLIHSHRGEYFELRNAMFISGAIGLVIFAFFPVTPPRLLGADYFDTVTEYSRSYRVLQPPALVNKYAAVPSLHFGWNLLVGLAWFRLTRGRGISLLGVLMPVAMGFAVVATANHWTFDILAGGMVALAGLAIERSRRRVLDRRHRTDIIDLTDAANPVPSLQSADRTDRAHDVRVG